MNVGPVVGVLWDIVVLRRSEETQVMDIDRGVAVELDRVAVLGQKVIPVVETFNPLRERGDVITIERARETITGRIKSIDRGSGPTMTMRVVVNG